MSGRAADGSHITGGAPAQGRALGRAEAAWAPLPDWVRILAEECDLRSQSRIAGEIGYSASVVNQVLSRTYRGDLTRVEGKVRGCFMGAAVICPVLGEIKTSECLDYQKRPLICASPEDVQLWRACQSCPNARTSQ